MKKLLFSVLLLIPSIAFAQDTGNYFQGITGMVNSFGSILATLVPLAFGLALLFFFYGIAKFVLAAGNPASKAEGKSIMIWGVIALFVMASIWGLVKFIDVEFNITPSTSPQTVPNFS